MTFSPALKAEYERLYVTCEVLPYREQDLNGIVDRLYALRARYAAAARQVKAPWQFVACIHQMERGAKFDGHLHNGDPLTARTIHAPADRPIAGTPPFTWEASAFDALAMQQIGSVRDWSLSGTLYQLEKWNGFGYRLHHPEVRTPYLWAGSHHYTAGKFTADGKFDAKAVSQQIGAALLWKRLAFVQARASAAAGGEA